ncbi:DinB superfamily protein [Blastococcus aurantiacus]|uniref:DinB superfamily protein n=1 Tax=Blastococcus aurantiacus TaxID=1550231 RepID=A0A1G7R465_9ACTN|nr:DinB family protein [Blastococcus aurantiacus]SDG05566.1 DinB superfamily protein [Blastococcus aurantiacus]
MTLIHSVLGFVARSTVALEAQQTRVGLLVGAAADDGRWHAVLQPEDRRRLVHLGHFTEYAIELDWTVGDVAGHVRDSAQIFTDRLTRMCRERQPQLADFVTDAPERLADYRSRPPTQLLQELRRAQNTLLLTVAGIRATELSRTGHHPLIGPVSVADVLNFLPGHQLDHAQQLAAQLR